MKNGRAFNPKAKVFYKQASAREFEDGFLRQVGASRQPFGGPVFLFARIHYRSKLSDLDEALLMDLLQKANIIANDRQIEGKLCWKFYDREAPRVWFCVMEVEPNSKLFTMLKGLLVSGIRYLQDWV